MNINKSFVSKIKLFNFRNYDSYNISFSSKINVIYGSNGIGKTNILEAISLLSPGKGLRKVSLADFKNKQINNTKKTLRNRLMSNLGEWFVYSEIQDKYSAMDKISTGAILKNGRYSRILKINQKETRDQSLLNKYSSISWLTPKMNNLFNDSASTRRKFLDRTVYGIDSYHTTRVGNYEKLVRERMKLLTENSNPDKNWLNILEKEISELGVSIATSRINTINYLNKALTMFDTDFPRAAIELAGEVERLLLKSNNALEIESIYKKYLEENREKDKITQRTNFGTHKTDIIVMYLEKNMEASSCSTGEQKLLLISLILAKAKMYNFLNRPDNILLLDEVTSYLDESKRGKLFKELIDLDCQCFLTGTSRDAFNDLSNANFIELK